MNLHEKNLKNIIQEIEKYGAIQDVQICNSSLIVCPPSPLSNPKPSKIIEIDLNRAKDFVIKFKMGDIKGD